MITEFARAKVNLTLHITGRRSDGYHLLESLVVFPDIGDQLSFEGASDLSLEVVGAQSAELDGQDNIILRAAKSLQEAFDVSQGAHIILEKNLPVASGIGGGSADAAAALRGLCALWSLKPDASALHALALKLGADVAVCLGGASAMMSGIGDVVEPLEGLPAFHMVLVNCRKPVSTAAVFRSLITSEMTAAPSRISYKSASFSMMIESLAAGSNDMQEPATALEPEIKTCLESLATCKGVALTRMSGSGATCFGIFESRSLAEAARRDLSQRHPHWWIRAATVS